MFLERKKDDLECFLKIMENDIKKRDAEIFELENTLKGKSLRIDELEERLETSDHKHKKLTDEIQMLKKSEGQNEQENIMLNNPECKCCEKRKDSHTCLSKHVMNDHSDVRVCLFNDRGYCKFGRWCRFQHLNGICDVAGKCRRSNCRRRHPVPCRYGDECAFGPRCAFNHTFYRNESVVEDNDGKERKSDEEDLASVVGKLQ